MLLERCAFDMSLRDVSASLFHHVVAPYVLSVKQTSLLTVRPKTLFTEDLREMLLSPLFLFCITNLQSLTVVELPRALPKLM